MATLKNPSFIVGVIGSAGALNGYKAFLGALPANMGMAYVIISHMSTSAQSQLAKILSRHTTMPTMVAASAMPIRKNHVYVIPPNADLFIEGYTFKVVSPRASRSNQGDLFLISLAQEIGARAVGIILSGYASDGTEGCGHIKAKGGTTFAQDLSAEVDSMPHHAQASGKVDFVLPPEKMPSKLKQLAGRAEKKVVSDFKISAGANATSLSCPAISVASAATRSPSASRALDLGNIVAMARRSRPRLSRRSFGARGP